MSKQHTLKVYASRKVKGQWGWTLLAPNGLKIATCGELYKSKAHALKMAQSMTKRFAGHVLDMNKGPKKKPKKKPAPAKRITKKVTNPVK